MSLEATAEALATEDQAVVQEAPTEDSEDSELAAIYARTYDEGAEDQAEAEPEAAEDDAEQEAEEAPDEPEAEVEAPTELPRSVRDAWKDIPETARSAILDSQREMSRKLGEQGRLMQGLRPIQDSITKAIKDIPALSEMRPQDVADELFTLAKMSGDFQQKPVETMMGLIRQHGLEKAMSQALAGQPQTQDARNENAMMQHISRLEKRLAEVTDPSYIDGRVTEISDRRSAVSEVDRFASSAEHWSAVEQYMPAAVQFVQSSNQGLSTTDTLKRAYDLAVSQYLPEEKKAPPPAAEKAATPDPERTKAAQKAKSINVQGTASGKSRVLTEDEELARVYARMNS